MATSSSSGRGQGYSASTVKHSPGFLALVNQAKQRVKETTAEEVGVRLQRGETFHLVDVREDDEWRTGRAKGAVHLGKGIIERDIEKAIPNKEDEIILYCRGGFRSILAADALQQMGYTNVASMAGGIRTWTEANLPEDKD